MKSIKTALHLSPFKKKSIFLILKAKGCFLAVFRLQVACMWRW